MKRPGLAVLGGLGTGLFLLLALRISYKCQAVRREIETVDRRRNSLANRRTLALSLSRLDRLARGPFALQVPDSDQVRLIPDPA